MNDLQLGTYRYRIPDGFNWYVGKLPLRKGVAIYKETGNVAESVAWFRDEAAAEQFIREVCYGLTD